MRSKAKFFGDFLPEVRMQQVEQFREMVFHGEYDKILETPNLLTFIETRGQSAGLHEFERREVCTLLSEFYDQTSRYRDAANAIAFDPRGQAALEKLAARAAIEKDRLEQRRKENLSLGHKPAPEVKDQPVVTDADVRHHRSLAMFCLAHAISMHRRTGDRGTSLFAATQMAEDVREHLRNLERGGFHVEGAQSFVAYWLGRFYMLAGAKEEAEQSFSKSVYYQQANLDHHFREHDQQKKPHDAGSPRACSFCQNKVALSSYLVASNMAFGQAYLKLNDGNVREALMLLRPSLVLLEGSTVDRYRKGYVQLLIGTAHRILGGASIGKMEIPTQVLQRSRQLFGDRSVGNAAHRYYVARANYQLTLTYLFAAKDAEASDTAKAKWLSSAIGSFCVLSDPEVLVSSNRRTDEYADLDLYVRAQLLGCRLICELVRFDSFWTGKGMTKLLKRLELVPSLKRFSGSLASLLASAEREIIAQSPIRLLREAWSFLDAAKAFDTKLRGTRADRSALIIARVELICLNLEYCRTLSPDVVAPELWNEVEASIVQSSQALAEAQKTLRALLEDNSPLSSKKQASLYMAYAKTLLLSGATAEARKQMAYAADRLARGVEDRILHDEMEHLKQRMPPLQDQITLSLYSDGQQIPGKELENRFLAKLVQIANEEGLSLKETAARYSVDKDTITNWCKRGHYIWRDK